MFDNHENMAMITVILCLSVCAYDVFNKGGIEVYIT